MATGADLAHIPAIELSAAQTFRGTDTPASILTDRSEPEHWRPMLEAGTLWVAQADTAALVAFLAATAVGERLHIDEFDVAQPAQRRGLGRRMLEHVADCARGAGYSSLSLTTFRSFPWNAPFYGSCGFQVWRDELPADMAAHLADEAARGLKDRCAMRLPL